MLGLVQHRFHYVYRTVNLLNGKFYIGVHSTYNLNDGYLGSGKRLRRAIKKYGAENFEHQVITFFHRRELALEAEKVLLKTWLRHPQCYNIHEGGHGGWDHINCDPSNWSQANARRAFATKLRTDLEFAEKHRTIARVNCHTPEVEARRRATLEQRPEQKQRLLAGLDWTGRRHRLDSREKIGRSTAITSKGDRNGQFGKCWISHDDLQQTSRIVRSKLVEYEVQGWRAGRVMRYKHVKLASTKGLEPSSLP